MRIKIVRRLGLEEIRRRIKAYETTTGMPFSEFERRFVERELDAGLFGEYVEWAGLIHAYEAYVEGGELDYSIEETYDAKTEDLREMLMVKRLELLGAIATSHVESINDVARKVGRNVKNVYSDLKALEKMGFIRFRRAGRRNLIPESLIDEISIVIQ
jgi:hypothetical protein